jgi:cytoskeletal protein RodZ
MSARAKAPSPARFCASRAKSKNDASAPGDRVPSSRSEKLNMSDSVESNFGQRLTKAREARGLTVEDAAKSLRMRPSQIEALEKSNLAAFASAAYAKGFLVMYAKFLKIDLRENTRAIDTTKPMRVADFQYLTNRSSEDKELKRAAQDARYDFVVPERGSRSWLPLIVAGGAITLAAIGFGVWMNLSRIAKAEETAAAAPAPVTPVGVIAPVAPGTPAKAVADAEPVLAPKPVVVAPADVAPTPGSEALPEGTIPRARAISPVADLARNDTKALAEIGGAAPHPTPVVEAPSPTAVEIAPGDEGIQLEPKRKTWIVIRDGPGGLPIFEDYLYPNARPMHLPAGKYYIELKEADAVHIRKDGKRLTYQAPGLYLQ